MPAPKRDRPRPGSGAGKRSPTPPAPAEPEAPTAAPAQDGRVDRRGGAIAQEPPPPKAGEAPAEEAHAPVEAVEVPTDDGGDASAVEHDIDELLERARERDEYLSLAQRTQADFENYRKRAGKDIAAAEGRGVARLAREMLPALDNLALALAAAESGGEGEGQLVEGLKLVAAELTAALARVGIQSYSPHGERFDPTLHEAMAKQPVEGAEPGTVVEVYQQGYRAGDTVLRPARVVVAE